MLYFSADFGPIKYQAMIPRKGKINTINIHKIFVPISALEFMMFAIAHTANPNSTNPISQFNIVSPSIYPFS
jgi:hypothetical protein